MPLRFFGNIDVSSDGEFENLSVNDDLSAQNLFADDARLDQADIVLSQYSENTSDLNINSSNVTLDLSVGNTFILPLTSSIASFTLVNVPLNRAAFTLKVQQTSEGYARNISWNFNGNTIKWADGIVPTVSRVPSAEDIYSFTTFIGYGNINRVWYGFIGGQNFGNLTEPPLEPEPPPEPPVDPPVDPPVEPPVTPPVSVREYVNVNDVTYYYKPNINIGDSIYTSPTGNNVAQVAIEFVNEDFYNITTNNAGSVISKETWTWVVPPGVGVDVPSGGTVTPPLTSVTPINQLPIPPVSGTRRFKNYQIHYASLTCPTVVEIDFDAYPYYGAPIDLIIYLRKDAFMLQGTAVNIDPQWKKAYIVGRKIVVGGVETWEYFFPTLYTNNHFTLYEGVWTDMSNYLQPQPFHAYQTNYTGASGTRTSTTGCGQKYDREQWQLKQEYELNHNTGGSG